MQRSGGPQDLVQIHFSPVKFGNATGGDIRDRLASEGERVEGSSSGKEQDSAGHGSNANCRAARRWRYRRITNRLQILEVAAWLQQHSTFLCLLHMMMYVETAPTVSGANKVSISGTRNPLDVPAGRTRRPEGCQREVKPVQLCFAAIST